MSLASLPRVSNAVTPAVWVDAASIIRRGDVDVATLQFYHFMPDAAVEVARIQTSLLHLKALVDLFAKTIDYYPERPATKHK